MTRTIIDINILQTVPPSNINRDDTGSPKTAVYGGVRRARVSSQAWKRPTRLALGNYLTDLDRLGVRTKRVVELVSHRVHEKDPTIPIGRAEEFVVSALKAAKISVDVPRRSTKEDPLPAEANFLLFVSPWQVDALADLLIESAATSSKPNKITKDAVQNALSAQHSIDIALFGRMVATGQGGVELGIDAAAQVAHAISVHPVENEFDYFTAVDDHKDADDEEDAGAGMIGTVEFNSSTLYRYATVDANRLRDNLGDDEATRRAVEAFVQAFSRSLPTGKQNTFANRTLPDAIVISVRDSQPVNLAGAFEEAITTPSGRLKAASAALASQATSVDHAYGTTPVKTWVIRVSEAADALDPLGERTSLDAAVIALGSLVAERLAEPA